jgi:hypothetical protein
MEAQDCAYKGGKYDGYSRTCTMPDSGSSSSSGPDIGTQLFFEILKESARRADAAQHAKQLELNRRCDGLSAEDCAAMHRAQDYCAEHYPRSQGACMERQRRAYYGED